MSKRVLFVLKKRNSTYGVSFGLKNSAEANARGLIQMGHDALVVQVVDNNGIDKEVHDYKPTHVIIEALWVVPAKMKVLADLYPQINWYVCIHSKTPFLANEGIAFPWIKELAELHETTPNLYLAANNKEFNQDLSEVVNQETFYLPNMYFPFGNLTPAKPRYSETVRIGCFGAMRPMKNILQQGIASIKFAQSLGKELEFHVNAVTEQQGENTLKNLRAVFAITGHKLVEHGWLKHEDFIELIKTMDIGLQVSLSESFNIVTADFVHHNIPMVVSTDVTWMRPWARCVPSISEEIVTALKLAYLFPFLKAFSTHALKRHNKKAARQWDNFLDDSLGI